MGGGLRSLLSSHSRRFRTTVTHLEVVAIDLGDRLMQITYELTRKDFREAFAAAHKWHHRIHGVLLSIGISGIVWNLLLLRFKVVVEIIFGLLWWGLWVSLPASAFVRNQFAKWSSEKAPRTFSWNSSGVYWQWGSGSVNNAWKNIIRCVEANSHFLLFTSPAAFDVLPKRAFDDGQLADFRSALATYIQATK